MSTRSRPRANCAVDVFKLGLSPEAYERLKIIAGSKMTTGGELIITARRFRTQEANRADARERLAEMIAAAHIVQAKRRADQPEPVGQGQARRREKGPQRDQGRPRESEFRLMYDFKIAAADKPTLYRDLAAALEALVAGEPDGIANMANAAALIWETLPDLNWVGLLPQCRRRTGARAVPGPRRPASASRSARACAARRRQTLQVQRVDDVHAFPGHIACDSASNSELVVPIVRDGELLGVLDLDSPNMARFDAEDEAGCRRAWREILARRALAQLLQLLVAQRCPG